MLCELNVSKGSSEQFSDIKRGRRTHRRGSSSDAFKTAAHAGSGSWEAQGGDQMEDGRITYCGEIMTGETKEREQRMQIPVVITFKAASS